MTIHTKPPSGRLYVPGAAVGQVLVCVTAGTMEPGGAPALGYKATVGPNGAKSGTTIVVPFQLTDAAGAAVALAGVELLVRVSDGAADYEPSATATLGAASPAVGTLLTGTGAATAAYRTDSTGKVSIAVTEPTAGQFRFLWIAQGANTRAPFTVTNAPQQLTF